MSEQKFKKEFSFWIFSFSNTNVKDWQFEQEMFFYHWWFFLLLYWFDSSPIYRNFTLQWTKVKLSVEKFLSFPLDKNFINVRKKTMNLITLKLGKLNLTCIIFPKVLRFIVFRFNCYFGTLYSWSWISGQYNSTRFNRSCIETYDSKWDILWFDKKKFSKISKI